MLYLQPIFLPKQLLITGLTAFSLACYGCNSFSQAESELVAVSEVSPITDVVAFGRLTPKGEIIALSVPNAEDSRVNKIMVEEGDLVEANQVIAILQGIERKERDLEEAIRNVDLHQAKLRKILAGDGTESEIAAQQATINRLKAQLQYESIERKAAINSVRAELNQAKLTYQRRESLLKDGAISQDELDRSREQLTIVEALLEQRKAQLNNTIRTLEQQIAQEQRNLSTLQESHPIDIEIAEAELAMAKVAVAQRKADLEDTKVRVPVGGRILRINTRVGERVDIQKGIVELGQTHEMYAVAEVYETEISQIKLGQKAVIESEYGGFDAEITGKVAYVGLQIGKRTLTGESADPTTDQNTRIVEVKIRIDDEYSNMVANLTGMQVRVTIDIE